MAVDEKEWRDLVIKVSRQLRSGIRLSQDSAYKFARAWVRNKRKRHGH